MAQVTDRSVGANPTGFDMRTEINNIIGALESDNSGSSEPLNTVAYMKWLDTSNATYYYVKERNHDNTAWVTLFRYTVATKIMEAVSNGVILNDVVVHKTGDETKTGILNLPDGLVLQGQNVSPFSGFKNYLINVSFDIWQRGVDFPAASSWEYTADRWKVYGSSGSMNISKFVSVNLKAALKWVKNNSNKEYLIQRVEDVRTVNPYENGSVDGVMDFTLSFLLHSTVATTFTFGYGFYYGTGGSASIQEPNNKIVSVEAGVVTLISHTFQVDANTYYNNKSIGPDSFFQVHLSHMEAVNGEFVIISAQLEKGSIATTCEHRPPGAELSLCREFFRRDRIVVSAPTVTGNFYGSIPVNLPPMRRAPTFSVKSVLASNYWLGSLACNSSSYGVLIVTASQQQTTSGAYIDAVCDFSAEL